MSFEESTGKNTESCEGSRLLPGQRFDSVRHDALLRISADTRYHGAGATGSSPVGATNTERSLLLSIGVSSNGRTADFESAYGGSNPSAPTSATLTVNNGRLSR